MLEVRQQRLLEVVAVRRVVGIEYRVVAAMRVRGDHLVQRLRAVGRPVCEIGRMRERHAERRGKRGQKSSIQLRHGVAPFLDIVMTDR